MNGLFKKKSWWFKDELPGGYSPAEVVGSIAVIAAIVALVVALCL